MSKTASAPVLPEDLRGLVDLLHFRARQQPDRESHRFLSYDGESREDVLPYGELDRRARAIAEVLRRSSLKIGDRALLLYPPGIEFIVGFFGCLYAGLIAVPAFPPVPERLERTLLRLRQLCHDSGPVAVLTDSTIGKLVEAIDPLPDELASIPWIATDAVCVRDAEWWSPPDLGLDAIAMLQYTSGSTGSPKGVMLSQGNLLANLELVCRSFGLEPDDRVLSWLPPYHDLGLISTILSPIYAGCLSIQMSPMAFLRKPSRWLVAISEQGATTSGAPNFAYDLVVNRIRPEECDTLELSSWRNAFIGGEPVRAATLERFTRSFKVCGFRPESLLPAYGLAEATLGVSLGRPPSTATRLPVDRAALERGCAVRSAPGLSETRELVSVGGIRDAQPLRIVDPETRCLCADGEVGEIWLRGSSVARGYWGRADETRDTFEAQMEGNEGGCHLRTGDLGVVWNGELFITGRIKDMIIVGGRNIAPQDLEECAERSFEALRPGGCAAFSVDVADAEGVVIANEVRDSSSPVHDLALEAIRHAIWREHNLSPTAIVLVPPRTVPKTTSGKVQRRACRSLLLAGKLDVVAAWPKGWRKNVGILASE